MMNNSFNCLTEKYDRLTALIDESSHLIILSIINQAINPEINQLINPIKQPINQSITRTVENRRSLVNTTIFTLN